MIQFKGEKKKKKNAELPLTATSKMHQSAPVVSSNFII